MKWLLDMLTFGWQNPVQKARKELSPTFNKNFGTWHAVLLACAVSVQFSQLTWSPEWLAGEQGDLQWRKIDLTFAFFFKSQNH